MLLNEVHDRSEDRQHGQARQGPPASEPGSASEKKEDLHLSNLFVELRKLQSKHDTLENQVNRLREQVARLDSDVQEFLYRRLPPESEADQPKRASSKGSSSTGSAPRWANPPSRSSDVPLESLEQAVTEALGTANLGGLGSDELRQTVQSQLGGVQLDVQLVGRQRPDGWQMLALWPPQSQEGVLLVSPGELIDPEVAQYFEGEFGRRIRSCRMPARVRREGNGLSVLRKGRVEIS